MKKKIFVVMLALFFLVLALTTQKEDPQDYETKKGNIVDASKAIVRLTVVGPNGMAYCTGFHVGEGYYVTAAHCAQEIVLIVENDVSIHILNTLVLDNDNDVAILHGPVMPEALVISPVSERYWGEGLITIGYPGWLNGTILAEPTRLISFGLYGELPSLLTQNNCAPGCSGGPLLTTDFKVAGSFVGYLLNRYDSSDEQHHHHDYNRYVRSDVIFSKLEIAKSLLDEVLEVDQAAVNIKE